jgi:glycosyltransferase involved in cell wall biosynthesis
MHLLMLSQFFPPDIGGEERHVFNLANALADRGHTVSVATQRIAGTPVEEQLPSGVNVYRFETMAMRLPSLYSTDRPHHPPFPDPVAVRGLREILRRAQPQVVHAHNWAVNSLLPVNRQHEAGGRFGVVLTLHDYSHVCATKRMMRDGVACAGPGVRCLPCATAHYGAAIGPATVLANAAIRPWKRHVIDQVVCVSRAVAIGNRLTEGPTVSVIPNFIPDAMAAWSDDLSTGTSSEAGVPELPAGEFILFVGDLSAEKGVLTLLRAYERLGESRPPLVLIGRRVADTPSDLPPGVIMHEAWPHEHVLRAFRHCAVAVLPSVWPDPCPTTVLEAMANGCPVITTAIGGMVDMVTDGDSGLLVPPGDTSALTAAMGRLLNDERLRASLVDGAKKRVAGFTATSVAERLEAVYARAASVR